MRKAHDNISLKKGKKRERKEKRSHILAFLQPRMDIQDVDIVWEDGWQRRSQILVVE